MIKTVDEKLFNTMCEQARNSERKRSHYTLHECLDDSIHRLCIAIEPGSYIRPHRHFKDNKFELLTILRGRLQVVSFADDSTVVNKVILDAAEGIKAVELSSDTWHTIVALENNSVMLEVKPGPYMTPAAEDFAAWAPAEGEAGSKDFYCRFLNAEVGKKLT